MLFKSTVLFKVCFLFIVIGLLLDVAAFATVHWLVDGGGHLWTSGLWQICVVDGQVNDTVTTLCSSAQEYAYLLAHVPANTTSVSVPGWFKAVQTAETFGLLCSIICAVMASAQLCYVSKPRLERVTIFVCVFAGIFTDIGIIIILWNFDIASSGFSFWMALISSVFFFMAGALIEIDLIRKGYNEEVVLSGEPIKGGVIVHICGSGRPNTPPSSPIRDSMLEEDYTTVYQTPRAKAVVKDRPSSAVFVPLPEIQITQHGNRDSVGSRVRISISDLPPDEPPPPYTLAKISESKSAKKKARNK